MPKREEVYTRLLNFFFAEDLSFQSYLFCRFVVYVKRVLNFFPVALLDMVVLSFYFGIVEC